MALQTGLLMGFVSLFLGSPDPVPWLVETDVKNDYTVACYYFPNYHVDTRNEQRHGPGWTEWELVKRAVPRFPGHVQPKVPAWGYTDEADPADMAQKIEAAADHGIDAFIFDWYYFDDGPFLQRGIEEGFFGAANNSRIDFAVMWANHDWFDIHPKKRSNKPELEYPGTITPETWDRMTDFLVETYFSHPSYWKIFGQPYFSIYDLTKLIASFGSVEATHKALDAFRRKTFAAGHRGLHLNAVVWGQTILPGEEAPAEPFSVTHDLGFNSVTSYVWIHHVALPDFPRTSYDYVMAKYLDYARSSFGRLAIPYYPNVSMGWDSSPRACQSDVLTNDGYPFMASLSGNTPAAFKRSLEGVKALLDEQPPEQRILNINCWNEWTEGSYLEPDTVHGMAYLEAVRDVFGE